MNRLNGSGAEGYTPATPPDIDITAEGSRECLAEIRKALDAYALDPSHPKAMRLFDWCLNCITDLLDQLGYGHGAVARVKRPQCQVCGGDCVFKGKGNITSGAEGYTLYWKCTCCGAMTSWIYMKRGGR
jgi:hypothetical protein